VNNDIYENASTNVAIGHWYRVRVDWQNDSTIDVAIWNRSSQATIDDFSVSNDSYTSGGVGFFTNSQTGENAITYYDGVNITTPATTSGHIVREYESFGKARQAALSWDSQANGGSVTKSVRFGNNTYTDWSSSGDWKDLTDGENLSVKFDLSRPSAEDTSPMLTDYTVEWFSYKRGILVNESDPVTVELATDQPNAVTEYTGSVNGARNISQNFSVDTTQPGTLTVEEFDVNPESEENVTTFVMDMPSGTMNATIHNLEANEGYTVYQDGSEFTEVTTNANGTLSFEKVGGWSEHTFRVVAGSDGSTDQGTLLGGDGCRDGEIEIPFLGCVSILVTGTVVVIVGSLGLLAIRSQLKN
jgi:hypothetical protein